MKRLRSLPGSSRQWLLAAIAGAIVAGVVLAVRAVTQYQSNNWIAGDTQLLPTGTSPATPRDQIDEPGRDTSGDQLGADPEATS